MSDYLRQLTERFGLPELIVTVLGVALGALVLAAGFDFELNEVAEVVLTGVLVVAVMGVLAGVAWGVGRLLDLLEPPSS